MPKKMNEKVSNMNANEPNKGHFSDFLPKTNGEYLTSDNVAINKDLLQEKAMKDLNARISTIIADPKITDKRGYFLSNYGSYLKTLGSMEQNSLLSKFPVMGFDKFQNIGRNIGQK